MYDHSHMHLVGQTNDRARKKTQNCETETETGLPNLENRKRLDRTGVNPSLSVFCGLKTGLDWMSTGLDRYSVVYDFNI